MAGPAHPACREAGLIDVPAPGGVIRGRVEDGIAVFRGIPCAAARPEAVGMAGKISGTVAESAATGDLTASALGRWPAFTPAKPVTVVIARGAVARADHLAERLDFWEAHRADSAPALESVGISAGGSDR